MVWQQVRMWLATARLWQFKQRNLNWNYFFASSSSFKHRHKYTHALDSLRFSALSYTHPKTSGSFIFSTIWSLVSYLPYHSIVIHLILNQLNGFFFLFFLSFLSLLVFLNHSRLNLDPLLSCYKINIKDKSKR